jgi:hypothetical protein
MKRLSLPLLALLLGACASQPAPAPTDSAAGNAVASAVVSPLNDLNLVHAAIPPVLQAAQKQPYQVPEDSSCPALSAQITALTEVLGADLDAPPTPGNPGLLERGGNVVGDAAGGALKSAAENLVPFRGWVRKLSGAERYSREVASAIAAGGARRAFLKGLAVGRACPK